MDLSSEMNKHGRNPVSHKLEDQKKVRLFLIILNIFEPLANSLIFSKLEINVLLRIK